MKRKTIDVEDRLHTAIGPSSSEVNNGDLVLEPKHKIFLNHSGAQKEFVDHLCKALEERCHYPFFDRRPESLPKGKKFADLIVKATQQCQLFVVVISEEYFMSKWPMIELNAFVKASKKMKSNKNQGILPLFYGLCVSELKEEKRRKRWFETWETFAREDSQACIKVDEWRYALDELTKFNGLSYDRELKQVVEYENEIVSHICELVLPDIKWEDSHVQGNAHKVVIEKMKQVQASKSIQVFGLYGVGGIGKTTTCKTLCNELSSAFEGRACHIEFDSTASNFKELLQKVLIKLTRKSPEVVQLLDEGECKDVLYKNLMKQKTFLAIDNVWDNAKSIKQAQVFVQAPSHPNSLLLVTTRAERTMELLGIGGGASLKMPKLRQGDATKLFLHYASNGQQFTSEEDMSFIDLCVKRCYFSEGDGVGYHYHPLALEALGRQLGCHGKNPSKWKEVLPSLRNFNAFFEAKEVFDVLRISFDLLEPNEQALFMDVGIFLRCSFTYAYEDLYCIVWSERLYTLYKQEDLQSLLNGLKGKGLLQDANLSLGKLSMHDLYHVLVVLEAEGKLVQATSIGNRRWMHIDIRDGDLSKLEVTPAGRCWENLTRLSIIGDGHLITSPIESFAGIEWQYFSNVMVLKLYKLSFIKGTLNLKGMKCLRSLQVFYLPSVERLEGLEGLTNLIHFEWNFYIIRTYPDFYSTGLTKRQAIVGQFPRSLKYLHICGDCELSSMDVLAQCTNLYKLILVDMKVGVQLNLSNCLSLKHVALRCIKNLQALLLPSTRMASRLQSLDISNCSYRIDFQRLDKLVSLERLYIDLCEAQKEVLNLVTFTKLQVLHAHGRRDSIELLIPHQLQEFHHKWSTSIKAPSLSGFSQLQVLDFSYNHNLACMSEIGDLPALRSLDLCCCRDLRRLPNLGKSRNLEKLNIHECDTLELHEEDIRTLATLPSLDPVHYTSSCAKERIKLDFAGQKVFRYIETYGLLLDQTEDLWEEKEEFWQPPIKLRERCS